MFRSYSDIENGRARNSPHLRLQLEANQILNRTPVVTKEMLNKLQNASDRRVICGYELHLRQISILIALFVLFSLGVFTIFIIFGTPIYENYVLDYNLRIGNTSVNFKAFKNPERDLVRVYIYNYTNVNDVARGKADKLKVNEIGPYIYRHITERINISFNDDGELVSYQLNHSYVFDQKMSGDLGQFDRIIVPNIPMISATAISKNYYILTRWGLAAVLKSLHAEPFIPLNVHNFLFGYEDRLFTLVKSVPGLTKPLPFDRFGLLAMRNGVDESIVQVHTGQNNLDDIGRIEKLNGRQYYEHWLTEECNKIDGVDGYFFSPYRIGRKEDIVIQLRDLCRRMRFKYERTRLIYNGDISVYRYVLDNSTFDNSAENQCYCTKSNECALRGLFNATECLFGTPMYASMPHYYQADERLREMVDGIPEPVKERDESYIEVHPLMGFSVQGFSRIQTNIFVERIPGFPQLSIFKGNTFLPISWIEYGVDASLFGDETRHQIYNATYLFKNAKLCIQIGAILIALLTFSGICLILRGSSCRRRKNESSNLIN